MYSRGTGLRSLWLVIGALLLIVGGLGYAAGQGAVPGVDEHRLLLPASWLRTWRGWGDWPAVVIGLVGVLVALLGAKLLHASTRVRRTDSLRDIRFTPPARERAGIGASAGRATASDDVAPHGATVAGEPRAADEHDGHRIGGVTAVRGATLAQAAERALRGDRHVRNAWVTLRNRGDGTGLAARVDVPPTSEVADVRRALGTMCDQLAATIGEGPRDVDVTLRLLRPSSRPEPRVR